MINNPSNNNAVFSSADHVDAEHPPSLFEKVTASVENAKESIQNFCSTFKTKPVKAVDIYKGNRYTLTQNTGQEKDMDVYTAAQKNPIPLTKQQQKILRSHGIGAEISLQPAYIDDGKCTGGTAYFLHKVLNNASTEELVGIFKEGIPYEAAINHEIYLKIFEPLSESGVADKLEAGLKTVSDFLFSSKSQKKKALKKDPSPDLLKHELALLSLNNLAVDEVVMNFQKSKELNIASFEQQANYLMDLIPDLPPGAYKFTVPNHSGLGDYKATHTIGFVKKENTTLYYDANFAITEVKNGNNQNTIKRILRYYTGYSSTKAETIANIWQGNANMPAPWSTWESIELIKVKKIDN